MVLSLSSFAQNSAPPRYEVGGQVSIINFNPIFDFKRIEVGGGGRFTFNINEYLAAETQVDFFKKDEPLRIATVGIETVELPLWGNKTLAVFGVKSGWRNRRIGVFGKARPGFVHFSSVPGLIGRFDALVSPALPVPKKTAFAMDAGGVFEYYPTRGAVFRLDMGDTIVRRDRQFFIGNSHTFQLSMGVGIRF